MKALDFYKTVTRDMSHFLERLIGLLQEHEVRFCVIGGQAVNAYAEPVVTLDLDLAIAVEQLGLARTVLEREFAVREFPHSLNVSASGSDLRVQIQLGPESSDYPGRASDREILGMRLPVARIEDVLDGKLRAASDPTRRPSKQLKDLADIVRLLEARPDLELRVPAEIRARIAAAGARG